MTAQTVELREQARAMDELEAELLGLRMGINGASPEKLQDRRRKEIRRNLVEEMMDDEPVRYIRYIRYNCYTRYTRDIAGGQGGD